MGLVRDTWRSVAPRLARDLDDPVEGTTQTIWPGVSAFWSETYSASGGYISPKNASRIWAAERCIQLNAQQIASMPLRFRSSAPGGGYEPAWIASPDPVWYPNGVGDAMFSIVRSVYGHGFSIQQITSRYSSGYPSAWTVIDPNVVDIRLDETGRRREYEINGVLVPAADIVQIDRNPGTALHGTSALSAYAAIAWGLVSAGELSRTFLMGGTPQMVLRPKRRVDEAQAQALQAQWSAATTRRGGAPPVLPPDLDFDTISLSPKDLALLTEQEFGARAIASAYGVPAHFLNIPLEGGLTYQNPAMLGEQWWRFELRTLAKRIADAFSAQMLPAGNWIEVDASDTYAPIVQTSDDPERADDAVPIEEPNVAGASPSDSGGSTVVPIRGVGG